MYEGILRLFGGSEVRTRTWSGNDRQIGLLGSLGFREQERIVDDRGAGIDTIYFVYRRDLV